MPLAAVFFVFFALPIVLVVVVSFFGYETYRLLIPDFTFENYRDVFSEAVTYRTYLITLEFCASCGRSRWSWLSDRLFPRLPGPQRDLADRIAAALYNPRSGPRS